MDNNGSNLRLCAVGDNAAFNDKNISAYEFVAPFLRDADIRFGQNERHYNDRKDLLPMILACPGGMTEITGKDKAGGLKEANFDVMSFASNHSMDLGPDIMMETVEVLKKLGVAVIGAGRNINEARQPAIIERKRTRVGFLGYCSVLRSNCEAGESRPGCVPMRAATVYEQIDYQPGTPPRIITSPYMDDLAAIIKDIKNLKSKADIVVVSFHWGVHNIDAVLANYQREVSHAVIDAGADVILGHHPHVLKGIEVYKGKPIFYSMGNFAFDPVSGYYTAEEREVINKNSHFHSTWRELYFNCDRTIRKKSMIVRCDFSGKELKRVSYLPVLINEKSQPVALTRKESAFDEAFKYMTGITQSQGLKTKFSAEGNEIIIDLS